MPSPRKVPLRTQLDQKLALAREVAEKVRCRCKAGASPLQDCEEELRNFTKIIEEAQGILLAMDKEEEELCKLESKIPDLRAEWSAFTCVL